MRQRNADSTDLSESKAAIARMGIEIPVSLRARLQIDAFRLNGTRADRGVFRALFFVAAVMLLFYLGVSYYSQLNSDSVMKLMLGQEMADQFALVPRGWDYENDIPIIFPSLIAAPLALFFPPSFPMHVIVDVLAAALLLYTAYAASRAVGISGPLRWFAPILLASGMSKDFAEFVFGQAAYAGLLFALFAMAGCGARYLSLPEEREGSQRMRRLDASVIALLTTAGVAGGPRGLATYALPVISALIATYLLTRRENNSVRRRTRWLLLVVTGAAFVGGICFLLLLLRVNYHSGSIPRSLIDGMHIAKNLQTSAENWLTLFGALPNANMPLNYVTAIPYAAHFCIAAVAFLLPLYLLIRIWKIEAPALRFLIFLHAALLGSLGSVLVLTGILDQEPNGIPRYFSPLVPTSFLIIGLWLQDLGARRNFPTARIAWLFALAFLMFSPRLLIAPAFADWSNPTLGLAANPRTQLIAALKQAGLTRGYATYWHANAITVLSAGNVLALPILIDSGGLPQRQHFMTADHWFEQPTHDMSFFLLLDPVDRRKINRAALDAELGQPTKSLQVGPFEVAVYSSGQEKGLGIAGTENPTSIRKAPATCAATYEALDDRLELKPDTFGRLRVRATNGSATAWPRESSPLFRPGVRILDLEGHQLAELRGALMHPVAPGQSIDLDIPLRAPAVGDYVVKFSFVIEGYAWCGNLGANWISVPLSVKP